MRFLSEEKEKKYKLLLVECITSLDAIVQNFINECLIDKKRYSNEIKQLLDASFTSELDNESVLHTIKQTIKVMKMIEQEVVGDLTEMKKRRSRVEELMSILQIGLAHIDAALTRMKNLRSKPYQKQPLKV